MSLDKRIDLFRVVQELSDELMANGSISDAKRILTRDGRDSWCMGMNLLQGNGVLKYQILDGKGTSTILPPHSADTDDKYYYKITEFNEKKFNDFRLENNIPTKSKAYIFEGDEDSGCMESIAKAREESVKMTRKLLDEIYSVGESRDDLSFYIKKDGTVNKYVERNVKASLEYDSYPIVEIGGIEYHLPRNIRAGTASEVIEYAASDANLGNSIRREDLAKVIDGLSPKDSLRAVLKNNIFGEGNTLSRFAHIAASAITILPETTLSEQEAEVIKNESVPV